MKYIIITGVSTGIGRTYAEYYLKKGDFVFGSVRNRVGSKSTTECYSVVSSTSTE